MSHDQEVESLFDEWAIEDGARSMSREHWARVEPVLSGLESSTGRYLEIGPGNGYSLEYMARTKFASGQCCAVELSSEMARICADKVYGRGNVAIEIGNFMTWESPPNVQFDLIFSMEVFYYFEDVCFAIKKAANLLAENGELIVMVDYYDESPDSEGWSNELGIKLSRWSKSRYFNAFEAAGLQAVAQEVKSGGVCEHGLTLCTRGIRRSAATPAGGNKPGYISS